MSNLLVMIALLSAVLSVVLLIAAVLTIRRKQLFGATASLLLAALLLAVAGLLGLISFSTQGYRALTREDVAAFVRIEPLGIKNFRATFRFADDGREKTFDLAGDEVYVDARILKWKPIVNILGLHTDYELDRVAGRYMDIEDEKKETRTIYSLSDEKMVDMFTLRRRYPLFRPLVDAEYGSATFVLADKAADFEIRVSTTGLLIRKVGRGGR